MLKTDSLLNDTYKITAKIGSGSGGVVYKAFHVRMRKNVAVKLIKDEVKSDIFNRSEVDVLKDLKNDYLPQVLDFVEDGEDVYTVMEFVEGQNFKQLIKSGRQFTEAQVRKYALQLCDAVKYLHDHVPPIIHSDIKPSNIMLTPEDNICLIDFNISMMSDNGIAVSKGGSKDFAAPEQFKRVINTPYEADEFHEETRFIENDETEILSDNSESFFGRSMKTKNIGKAYIDFRTDIYGMGASLYFILTGRIPCDGKPDFRGIKVSANMQNVITKAMDPDPQARYKTVSEMEGALSGQKPVHSKKASIAIASSVVAAAAIAAVGVNYVNNGSAASDNAYDTATETVHIVVSADDTENEPIETVSRSSSRNSVSEIETTAPDDEGSLANGLQINLIMPEMIGRDYKNALQILESMGLEYEISFSDKKYVDVGENCVYLQSPKSGTNVSEDTVVKLGISTYKDADVSSTTSAAAITAGRTVTTKQSEKKQVTKTSSDNAVPEGITYANTIKAWTETECSGVMYVTEDCYSRERPVIGSTPIANFYKGDEVEVAAKTDTGYYKLAIGGYVHSDYLSYEKDFTQYFSNGSIRCRKTDTYSNGGYELTWYWLNGLSRFIEKYDKSDQLTNVQVIDLQSRTASYSGKPEMNADGYSYTRDNDSTSYPYIRIYLNSDRDVIKQEYLDKDKNVAFFRTYTVEMGADGYMSITWYTQDGDILAYNKYNADGSLYSRESYSATERASTATVQSK